jgi:hypothetical protein
MPLNDGHNPSRILLMSSLHAGHEITVFSGVALSWDAFGSILSNRLENSGNQYVLSMAYSLTFLPEYISSTGIRLFMIKNRFQLWR